MVQIEDKIHISEHQPILGVEDRVLIFFIPGNPGLSLFYESFAAQLINQLTRASSSSITANASLVFYGASLPGFEVNKETSEVRRKEELGLSHGPPYSLLEVIDAVEVDLLRISNSVAGRDGKLNIILMGHSVGSYIGLEILQRHRRRLEEGTREVPIVGAICLFPTVVDIGQSEKGKLLSALSRIPHFYLLVHFLCKALMLLLPSSLLNFITSSVTSPTAGLVTSAFLKSRHGVRQALFMGADEMRTITHDKWDEEIWGAAHPSEHGIRRPKLFFYFGEKDHWVADSTRDDLMKFRGRENGEEWKPVMEIDTLGIPHGFCISHSRPIAEVAARYVREIITADQRK